jgi:hypothetical protein
MIKSMLVVAAFLSFSSIASAQSCNELWYQRNAIFKAAGYCFKTARAISEFGNAGCLYDEEDELPLSALNRRRVANLVAEERHLGCR